MDATEEQAEDLLGEPIIRWDSMWHADGYDMLKPFGLAISGCIDGF